MTNTDTTLLPSRTTLAGAALVLVLLCLTSLYNYLLFHSLAELFSVVIACAIFMFAWNTRQYVENGYFLFLGIAYLCVGALDTLHTLAYPGMRIFTDYEYYANQLWIATRYLESLSLLAAFYFLPRERHLPVAAVIFGYGAITALLLLAIFYWRVFPECFVEGQGLTPFKIYSEYLICLLLLGAILLLQRQRGQFARAVFLLIQASLITTIGSELAFTFYVSNYGLSNLVGHVFKIVSFACMYEAIIATGLKAPHELLYRQLRRSTDELRQSNAVKDRLFGIIAHDLRNPFNIVVNFSALLRENYGQLDEASKREFIDHIHAAATKTHRLLENLLQWSLMQTQGIHFMPVAIRLRPLVEENLALLREQARQKDIALEATVPDDLIVHADAHMLDAVIRNLLANAVKFTDRGGRVGIAAEDRGDGVEIAVTDTGIGIDTEQQQRLLGDGPVPSRPGTRQESGTGLGLMLCKEFIHAHGGRLRLESGPGTGSRFSVTLPHGPDGGGARSAAMG